MKLRKRLDEIDWAEVWMWVGVALLGTGVALEFSWPSALIVVGLFVVYITVAHPLVIRRFASRVEE